MKRGLSNSSYTTGSGYSGDHKKPRQDSGHSASSTSSTHSLQGKQDWQRGYVDESDDSYDDASSDISSVRPVDLGVYEFPKSDSGVKTLVEKTIYFDVYEDTDYMYKITKDVKDCPSNTYSMQSTIDTTPILENANPRTRHIFSVIPDCVVARIAGNQVRRVYSNPNFQQFLAPFDVIDVKNNLCSQMIRKLILMQESAEKMNQSHSCKEYRFPLTIDGERFYPLHRLQMDQIPHTVLWNIQRQLTSFTKALKQAGYFVLVLNEGCILIDKLGNIRYHRPEYIYQLKRFKENQDAQVMEDQEEDLIQYIKSLLLRVKPEHNVHPQNWNPQSIMRDTCRCSSKPTDMKVFYYDAEDPVFSEHGGIKDALQGMVLLSCGLSGNAYVSTDNKYIIKTIPLGGEKKSEFQQERADEYESEIQNIEFLSGLDPYPDNIPKYHVYAKIACRGDMLYKYDNPFALNYRDIADWQSSQCCGMIIMSNFEDSQPVVTYLGALEKAFVKGEGMSEYRACLIDLYKVAHGLMQALNREKTGRFRYHSDLHFNNILVRRKNRAPLIPFQSQGKVQASLPPNGVHFEVTGLTYWREDLEYYIIDFGRFGYNESKETAFATMVYFITQQYLSKVSIPEIKVKGGIQNALPDSADQSLSMRTVDTETSTTHDDGPNSGSRVSNNNSLVSDGRSRVSEHFSFDDAMDSLQQKGVNPMFIERLTKGGSGGGGGSGDGGSSSFSGGVSGGGGSSSFSGGGVSGDGGVSGGGGVSGTSSY